MWVQGQAASKHHRYRSRDASGPAQVLEVNIMAPRSIEDIKARAEQELAEAVRTAREQRVSWREVGKAIGTSGEAARQRYSTSA